jgi:hypothetical protein
MIRYLSKSRATDLFDAAEKKVKTGSAGKLPWSFQKRSLTGAHRVQRRVWPEKYTDADPYKVLYVDPSSIEYHVNHNSTPRVFGTVAGGEWDQRQEPFAEVDIYKSLIQRFQYNACWEETEIFEKLVEEPDGRLWNRVCNSNHERLSRLQKIDELYHAIATEGYQTQRRLLERNSVTTKSLNNEECHPILNEVGVNIGRNGSLFWRHRGLHRLSIAKILDLDRIPILVLARHREWQETRNRMRTQPNEVELQLRSHPDLNDLNEA